jgi:cytochrome c551
MAPAGRSGRRLNDAAAEAGIVLVAIALMIAAAAAGFVVGRETGGGGGGAAEATSEVGETGAAGEEGETDAGPGVGEETNETDTGGSDGGGDTGGGDTGEGGDAAEGEAVFAEAGCGNCHTFSPANAQGQVGPSLDETDLDQEGVAQIVANGRGGMPAFEGQLSDEQIQAVAAYVAGR